MSGRTEDGPAQVKVEHVLAGMQVSYRSATLDEEHLAPTWHQQLNRWLADAVAIELHEPNAMVLATTDGDGHPSSRTVLAKEIDERGVIFYTNLTSTKVHELLATRWASATFPWFAMQRQAHLRGPAEKIDPAETAAYWATRPRGSQLGAWASPQSSVVPDRRWLDEALAQVAKRFEGVEQVPLPPHWSGVRIRPEVVEFWQGRENRMHDRLRYCRGSDGSWSIQRLAP